MLIETIEVKHFRSLLDQTLAIGDLTVLVGRNGAGKSCFLRALELFYDLNPLITQEDFYNRDISNEIVVSITYHDLPTVAQEQFKKYVDNDKLRVERVFKWNNGKPLIRFHGSRLGLQVFQSVRDAGGARAINDEYAKLRQTEAFAGLPATRNMADAVAAMEKWEEDHRDQCVRLRDDGQFFGFTAVGQGYLQQFTRLLVIPAQRDAASDATEAKGSALTQLLDLVVRAAMADKEEVKKFKQDAKEKYKALINADELQSLAEKISKGLKKYVRDSEVRLHWLELNELDIPVPRADVRIVEDGYEAPVWQTGHGLQRAFVLTMLESLAQAQQNRVGAPEQNAQAGARLILAIEEPELYQHPNRQRHFSKVLFDLAKGRVPGVTDKIQVIYGTHSPLLVGVDRLEHLRVVRKVQSEPEKPKVSNVIASNLGAVLATVKAAVDDDARVFTKDGFLSRIWAVMTPWVNEGFFADIVVLVEGEGDRAAILGYSSAMGHDFESMGIAVIPCIGKSNLIAPYAVFSQLGIKTYVLWDGDHREPPKGNDQAASSKYRDHCSREQKANSTLQRVFKIEPTEWPAFVGDQCACFKVNLNVTLRAEISIYDECVDKCMSELDIEDRDHAIKRPYFISMVVKEAIGRGTKSKTMEEIVARTVQLHGGATIAVPR